MVSKLDWLKTYTPSDEDATPVMTTLPEEPAAPTTGSKLDWLRGYGDEQTSAPTEPQASVPAPTMAPSVPSEYVHPNDSIITMMDEKPGSGGLNRARQYLYGSTVEGPVGLAWSMVGGGVAATAKMAAIAAGKLDQWTGISKGLGLLPALSDEEVVKLGRDVEEFIYTLGGTYNPVPTTPEGAMIMKPMEKLGQVAEHVTAPWVGLIPDEYPALKEAAKFGLETGVFAGAFGAAGLGAKGLAIGARRVKGHLKKGNKAAAEAQAKALLEQMEAQARDVSVMTREQAREFGVIAPSQPVFPAEQRASLGLSPDLLGPKHIIPGASADKGRINSLRNQLDALQKEAGAEEIGPATQVVLRMREEQRKAREQRPMKEVPESAVEDTGAFKSEQQMEVKDPKEIVPVDIERYPEWVESWVEDNLLPYKEELKRIETLHGEEKAQAKKELFPPDELIKLPQREKDLLLEAVDSFLDTGEATREVADYFHEFVKREDSSRRNRYLEEEKKILETQEKEQVDLTDDLLRVYTAELTERALAEGKTPDQVLAEMVDMAEHYTEIAGEGQRFSIMSLMDVVRNERGSSFIEKWFQRKGEDMAARKGYESLTEGQVNELVRLERKALKANMDLMSYLTEAEGFPIEAAKVMKTYLEIRRNMEKPEPVPMSESRFLAKGQDPHELLPRRQVPGKNAYRPPLKRMEAYMAEHMPNLGKAFFKRYWSIKNPPYMLDQLGPQARDFYGHQFQEKRSAAKREKAETKKAFKDRITQEVGTLTWEENRRLALYNVAQQKDGYARLEKMGIKRSEVPTKLTEKEQKAYNAPQGIFIDLFDRMNATSFKIGEEVIMPKDNYFPWLTDVVALAEMEGLYGVEGRRFRANLTNDISAMELTHRRHRSRSEVLKDKDGNVVKDADGVAITDTSMLQDTPLDLDFMSVMDRYIDHTLEYIHTAEHFAKMEETLLPRYGMQRKAPETHAVLGEYIRWLKGEKSPLDWNRNMLTDGLKIANQNVSFAVLAGSMQSYLSQFGALSLSYVKLGERYMGVGLAKALDRKNWALAEKMSNEMILREPVQEVILTDKGRRFSEETLKGRVANKYFTGQRFVADVGLAPLKALDHFSAQVTWWGAYEKGKATQITENNKSRFMTEKEAIRYADDVLVKTQASADKAHRAPIQRHDTGKMMTSLGTYVINQWNFLTREVFGYKNKNVSVGDVAANVARLAFASTVMYLIYDKAAGINSPLPTVIGGYDREMERSGDPEKAWKSGLMDMLNVVPIVGGSIRYDNQIGGPLANSILELMKGDPSAIPKLIGVPGWQPFEKVYRAYNRGGSWGDMALQRYVPPSTRRGMEGRGERGRDR